MTFRKLLALSVFSGFTLLAADESGAGRAAVPAEDASTPAAIWIWSNKNVYQPGERLTLRATSKPNADQGQYTLVAYRQNNQDGRKYFLPRGTEEATDIFGNTLVQGFRAGTIPELSKTVLLGENGLIGAAPAIPEEFGMHTLVLQVRDTSGRRVVKSAYWKIGVVREFVTLPNEITADRTLTNDRAYRISGIVAVRNAALTIEPGTFVIGQPGSQPPSVLLIANTGRLYAEGTRSRPIIMTSSLPIGERQRGDWGGLILLGKAPINDPGGNLPIEGLPDAPETRFGGTDPAHNCGSLRYVRVEFAGAQLRPNEETNSFTWGACGFSTQSSFLQSHYGFDDAFEWFGGNNDAKYLVGTYAADDYLDVQIGYTGRVQFALALANSDNSNRCIEADNYERDFAAKPLGKWQVWNLTCVGNNGTRGFDEPDASAIYLRRGAAGSYNNILVHNWQTRGLGIANDDSVLGNVASGDLSMNGLLFGPNGGLDNTVDNQVAAGFRNFFNGTARNTRLEDPKLRRPIEYSDPDLRALSGSAVGAPNWAQPPDDLFFDQSATFIGAFGETNWAEEWTTFHQEQDLKP